METADACLFIENSVIVNASLKSTTMRILTINMFFSCCLRQCFSAFLVTII